MIRSERAAPAQWLPVVFGVFIDLTQNLLIGRGKAWSVVPPASCLGGDGHKTLIVSGNRTEEQCIGAFRFPTSRSWNCALCFVCYRFDITFIETSPRLLSFLLCAGVVFSANVHWGIEEVRSNITWQRVQRWSYAFPVIFPTAVVPP
jgi:hypothetical protein